MKKIEQRYEYLESSLSELNESQMVLVNKSREMMKLAYAPYSNLSIGVSILLDNGEIVGGNNQENIAYPSGLCAERLAIFSASSRYPSAKIKTLVIISSLDEKLITPCGACRQVMQEQIRRQSSDFEIMIVSTRKVLIVKASILMPLVFQF
jgi:cytidine deaminase